MIHLCDAPAVADAIDDLAASG
jgi:hypothetical protein